LQKYGTFFGVGHGAFHDGWPATRERGGNADGMPGDGQMAEPTCG